MWEAAVVKALELRVVQGSEETVVAGRAGAFRRALVRGASPCSHCPSSPLCSQTLSLPHSAGLSVLCVMCQDGAKACRCISAFYLPIKP